MGLAVQNRPVTCSVPNTSQFCVADVTIFDNFGAWSLGSKLILIGRVMLRA